MISTFLKKKPVVWGAIITVFSAFVYLFFHNRVQDAALDRGDAVQSILQYRIDSMQRRNKLEITNLNNRDSATQKRIDTIIVFRMRDKAEFENFKKYQNAKINAVHSFNNIEFNKHISDIKDVNY